MRFRDVVQRLDAYRDELVIYAAARPSWQLDSRALVVLEPADESHPRLATGLTYLMQVARAKEVVAVWRRCRPGTVPTIDDLCDAILYYARHDAHEPVFDDAG